MSDTVKIAQAKSHFSELVARVEKGEEITIARGNVPVARLVPLERVARQPGLLRELLTAAQIEALEQAFDEPLSDREQRILEGEGTDDVGIWIGLPEDRET